MVAELDELDEEQKQAILQNPDVLKTLRYQIDSVEEAFGGLDALVNAEEDTDTEEAYELLVSGIAERSGRVTESTVEKVLSGFVDEVDEVTDNE